MTNNGGIVSAKQQPAWLAQVQQFQSEAVARALAGTGNQEVTSDPEVVGAALGVIAAALDKELSAAEESPALAARRAAFEAWAVWYFAGDVRDGRPVLGDWAPGLAWNVRTSGMQGYGNPALEDAWSSWQGSSEVSAHALRAFLAICQDELVRTSLTSLPLKAAFAKERGMSLGDVEPWMRKTRQAFSAAFAATGLAAQPAVAPSFVILRGVENNTAKPFPLPAESVGRKVRRVWLLLDEGHLIRTGNPVHHVNAFMDDHLHDWELTADGKSLRYYAHSSAKGAVVDVVLEFEA